MSIFDTPIVSDPQASIDQSQQQMRNVQLPQDPAMREQLAGQMREMGLMGPQAQGTAPPGMPQQIAQAGYLSPDQLTEMYGIMAGGATNPDQMMSQYVNAMQQQQQLDYQSSPIGQWLRLYGTVNPRDWTANSLRKFHKNFTDTGQLDYGLLERAEELSESENNQIIEAETLMSNARLEMEELRKMTGGFESEALAGITSGQGIRGTVKEWLERHITGGQDGVSALRQQYDTYKLKDVLDNLPPGVASDRDVALAMSTWPPKNANPAYLARWLRGMQKIKIAEMAMARHRAGYIGEQKKVHGLADDWDKHQDRYLKNAMEAAGLELVYSDEKDDKAYANNMWRKLHNLDPGIGFQQQLDAGGGTAEPGTVTPTPGGGNIDDDLNFIENL